MERSRCSSSPETITPAPRPAEIDDRQWSRSSVTMVAKLTGEPIVFDVARPTQLFVLEKRTARPTAADCA
jgi:hypothetical protein